MKRKSLLIFGGCCAVLSILFSYGLQYAFVFGLTDMVIAFHFIKCIGLPLSTFGLLFAGIDSKSKLRKVCSLAGILFCIIYLIGEISYLARFRNTNVFFWIVRLVLNVFPHLFINLSFLLSPQKPKTKEIVFITSIVMIAFLMLSSIIMIASPGFEWTSIINNISVQLVFVMYTIIVSKEKEETRQKGTFTMKSKMVAILLSVLLGGLGIDRFYLGYTGMGVLKLLTAGCFGILYIYDIIMICTGKLKPADGSDYEDETGAPAAARVDGVENQVAALEKLAKLHQQGILTDEEFNQKKADLLAKM